MLLVFSLDVILIGLMAAVSLYSFMELLFAASHLELQLLTSLMTALLLVVNIGSLIYFAITHFSEDTDTASDADAAAKAEKRGGDMLEVLESERVVQEKDGRLTITRTFRSVPTEGTAEVADEVREMVEKTPPLETPKQETSEFADLLEAEKPTN